MQAIPKKAASREAALHWLLNPFEQGRFYTEKETNALLKELSSTGDFPLLRRELCDSGLLSRTRNGSKYWRSDFLTGETDCGGITLRDLSLEDAPALLAIHESIRYYDNITGEAFTEEEAHSLIVKTDLPPEGSTEFFSAKMILTPDGKPAGYLAIYEGYPKPGSLWVGSLFLHREQQHKGIGKAVMSAVEEEAERCGFAEIGLGVYVLNTPGLQFWVNRGYDRIERVKVNEQGKTILGLIKNL